MTQKRGIRSTVPYLLLVPFLLFLALFLYGVINAILEGFGLMPSLGLTALTTDYYAKAFTGSDLSASILYSLYLAGVSSIIAIILGIVISAAVTRARLGQVGQLAGIQIPIMTSHSVAVLFIISMFAGTGLVARALYAGGIIADTTTFPTVVGAVSGWGIILVYVWKEAPFVAFCIITLMAHMGDRYAEAAACLGANPLQTFFAVTLPLCRGALTKAFLVIFAFAFGSYEVPFLLGATLPKALPVLAYIEFQSPDLLNRPYAMAINGIMAVIALALSIVYFLVIRREGREAR